MRALPVAHLSIRVPWHDTDWTGRVCKNPRGNSSCLVLPRIAENRKDEEEERLAGREWHKLDASEHPPCVVERGGFMSPRPFERLGHHPYAEFSERHRHIKPTRLSRPAFSEFCVPFRWMLKQTVDGEDGLENQLQLGFQPDREPDLEFGTSWVQDRDNQLALLDTFFSAMRPQTSLCFFYAKRTPLSEDHRRVLIGVGRITSVGAATEYEYDTKDPPLRCALWERAIGHSIRSDSADGFLLPYHGLLGEPQLDPSAFVAYAPDEHWLEFSFGSEQVSHDGAIAALLSIQAALQRIRPHVPGDWDRHLTWIDGELNRLWKMRGPFPGLGSALSALGVPRGNLVAYEIAEAQRQAAQEWEESPWTLVDQVFDDPNILEVGEIAGIDKTLTKTWKKLPAERRALLELLSRFEITKEQATRFYVGEERAKAGVELTDSQILANPYLLYEDDRAQPDAIAFEVVDRGAFPKAIVADKHPIPEPSRMTGALDERRVRALFVQLLEVFAGEGHTLQSTDSLVLAAREAKLDPPCPVHRDILAVVRDTFGGRIGEVKLAGGRPALQLDRLVRTRKIIGDTVRERLGANARRHLASLDWRALVDAELDRDTEGPRDDSTEEGRARIEKAAALQEIFSSRLSVLIGSAGTGKTTLLRALTNIPDVANGGVLLLAPTGKARVRLEQQTGRRGGGRTIAQFLNALGRYDGKTGRYLLDGRKKHEGHRTVVVDECSMLTEEQLAAVLEAVRGIERFVLVGDPQQLPPIGPGRPFVDIVRQLAPENVEVLFPRVGPGYAELTVRRRQKGAERACHRARCVAAGRAG